MQLFRSSPNPGAAASRSRSATGLARVAMIVAVVGAIGSASGQTATTPADPTTAIPGKLMNLSVRANLQVGQTMIAGFSMSGTGTDVLVVRAAGPSLEQFGVTNAMAHPKLTLYNAMSEAIATNTDWSRNPNPATTAGATTGATTTTTASGAITSTTSTTTINVAATTAVAASTTFASVGAFAFPSGSADAALFPTVTTSASITNYTVAVDSSDPSGSGTVLTEVYDGSLASANGQVKLTNLSVRASVDSDVGLIGGFVIGGNQPLTVLIRAAGPSLTTFGVTGAISDPKFDLMDSSGKVIASNDNWSDDLWNASDVSLAISLVGAFNFKRPSNDAATVVTLNPGAYTVRITGVGGVTGQTLMEIYALPWWWK